MGIVDRKLVEVFPPGEFLQEELEARGWLQADFAAILGKDAKTVSDILSGKRGITPDMAVLIGEALGTGAAVWLNLENGYRLHKAEANRSSEDDVARRASLYEKHPIREMAKRGWLSDSKDVDLLQSELKRFFSRPEFPYAARRSVDSSKEPLVMAWLYRVYNVAKTLSPSPYSETKLARALIELKTLLQQPSEMSKIPGILKDAGVRYLMVEQLPTSKIDGVCFWLDNRNPVVALTSRLDRIDNYWFTLIHELQHVKHRHGMDHAMLDEEIAESSPELSDEELLADAEATEYLVPRDEIENFIARVSPLFSATKITGFARRIGVHPGLVVGQLQHMGVIEYSHHRRMLPKVRDIITSTTPHDGWGVVAKGERE